MLEQRLYSAVFEDGDPEVVIGCLIPFRNDDGGFGHGLEPDKRLPHSQPLDVEIAFERLSMAGTHDPEMVMSACDWLQTVADERGAVPILLPPFAEFPRAAHWNAADYPPALNPTAAIAAHVHSFGLTHPWVERATDYCLSALETGDVPTEAHSLLGLTKLLAAVPDRDRADAIAPAISSALRTASFMNLDAGAQDYGLTPLEFAPSPVSYARPWFSSDVISAHLANLSAAQLADGGWPIAWEPSSEATRCEWRSIRTLWALCVLRAYV